MDSLEGNRWVEHFPGFVKLREHAKVLVDHTIAESACTPSRAAMMTGQYGPRTGVTQTDGLFKNGDAQNFPWLREGGTPTMGHWFRAAGYSTHYFGKWHVSNPPGHTLQAFGFDDWELSWPEPHGALSNNLGTYRDYQFADLACSFLQARGLGVPYDREVSQLAASDPGATASKDIAPFFAVCSFTNPHDIAAYPGLPRGLTSPPAFGPGASVPIPPAESQSKAPQSGTFTVPLNPTGFPQACAVASASQNEDLQTNNKPRCQYDYAYKLGLGLAAKAGLAAATGLANKTDAAKDVQAQLDAAVAATLQVAVPFQLQDDPSGAATGFLQYYAYMIAMVDRHILRVLEALDTAGLRDDTIVVFASDHGEYGAAHSMMMEKWHTAYQEAVGVPVLLSHPKLINASSQPEAVKAQTSHIDLLPTLLAYAGIDAEQREAIRRDLSLSHCAAPLPGADLRPVIERGCGPVSTPEGKQRTGVMFVTDDMITEPLPRDDDAHNVQSWEQYEVFCRTVEYLRREPQRGTDKPYLPGLTPGPVVQPCHVRALRSGPWKLVRYCDPWSKRPVADEWELYNLDLDTSEQCNLLVFDAQFPTIIAEDRLPAKLQGEREQLAAQAQQMRAELALQERMYLSAYPSEHPTALAGVALPDAQPPEHAAQPVHPIQPRPTVLSKI